MPESSSSPAVKRFPAWPQWTCCKWDDRRSAVCDAPATWQWTSGEIGAIPWPYCDRCKPFDAVPIPADAAYHNVRLDLRVVLAGAPVARELAIDEAVRRLTHAIEGIGGLIVEQRVIGGRRPAEPVSGPPLRLQLAGRPTPLGRRPSFVEAPSHPAARFKFRRR